jgi:hypothetical protein
MAQRAAHGTRAPRGKLRAPLGRKHLACGHLLANHGGAELGEEGADGDGEDNATDGGSDTEKMARDGDGEDGAYGDGKQRGVQGRRRRRPESGSVKARIGRGGGGNRLGVLWASVWGHIDMIYSRWRSNRAARRPHGHYYYRWRATPLFY